MKNRGWICLLAVAAVICGILSWFLARPDQQAVAVEVYSEGERLYTLPLGVDTRVEVISDRGTNVVTVRDGAVAVTEADCPDHYCMERGFCRGGTQIVCLPNRLVLKFVGGQAVDGVVG